jgi:hypothetical protein
VPGSYDLSSAPPSMTSATGALDHEPARPSWDCRSCGKPWPCDPARERMIADLDPVALAITMWHILEDAVLELPGMPPGELFDRFISWTH